MELCRKLTRWGLLSVAALAVALVAVGPVSADEKQDARKKKMEARQAAKKALREKQEAEAKAAATEPAKATPAPAPAPATKTVSRAKEIATLIDREIDKRLQSLKIPASPKADDAEFLRRVCLDITGVIPTAERARAFLDSKEPDKRAKLIDELLADSGYGRHMADMWQARLLPLDNSENRRLQADPFVKWLEENFNANKSWDKFVHELITVTGTQEENGAATYFVANATVDLITDSVTKQFLGIQLQCAQCHNHPFTGWKQEQYWEMAAFFMKVRTDRANAAARNGTSPGVSETPRATGNRQRLPESAKIVPARFLQGEQPKMDATAPYRPVLAAWITSPKNPYFARAMVNRTWAQFFARGLVNPVDDMHEANTPSHPELLAGLSEGFANEGFDLKDLIRGICNSEAYQRTSKPAAGNETAEAHVYSRMGIKALTPEQLYDSLVQVVGQPRGAANRPQQAQRGPQRGPRAAFVASFQHDETADPTEYQAGIPQALRLMNSSQFDTTTLVNSMRKGGLTTDAAVEQLYLSTLSRRPTAAEKDRLTAYVQKNDASKAYADIAWALLNSSEFALNR